MPTARQDIRDKQLERYRESNGEFGSSNTSISVRLVKIIQQDAFQISMDGLNFFLKNIKISVLIH